MLKFKSNESWYYSGSFWPIRCWITTKIKTIKNWINNSCAVHLHRTPSASRNNERLILWYCRLCFESCGWLFLSTATDKQQLCVTAQLLLLLWIYRICQSSKDATYVARTRARQFKGWTSIDHTCESTSKLAAKVRLVKSLDAAGG